MSNVILRVEDLAKSYQLGMRQSFSFPTIRDAISSLGQRKPKPRDILWALDSVSFELEQGDTLGLIGRNGSGKSTLLKILSRISLPTRGQVQLYGRVGSLLEVGTGFHPELSGRENIFLNGAILGMSRQEIIKHFDQIVDFAELDRFVDTPVKRYSSGMYMRLAFAVAAHLTPDILLVDEVLAVGDAQFQAKCLGKMNDVSQEGRTVIFVSHNAAAISKLCKKALLLENGKVVTLGPTANVLSRYLKGLTEGHQGVVQFPAKDGRANFSKITVLCPKNGPSANLDVTAGGTIEFEYTVYEPTQNLEVGFALVNSQGVTVFASSMTRGSGEFHDQGNYQASATIPGNFLVPGDYLISAGLHEPNVREFQVLQDALGFTVVETGSELQVYSGRDVGVVLANLMWHQGARRQPSKAESRTNSDPLPESPSEGKATT